MRYNSNNYIEPGHRICFICSALPKNSLVSGFRRGKIELFVILEFHAA
jgi:hypothetical protein